MKPHRVVPRVLRRRGLRWTGLLCLTGLGTLAPLAEPLPPALVPAPVRLEARPGTFHFTTATVLVAEGEAASAGEALASALRDATRLPLPRARGAGADRALVLELDSAATPALGTEGYRLSVTPAQVTLQAAAPAGLFYGGVTLRQLLPPQVWAAHAPAPAAAPDWTVPALAIEDRPRFAWRGLLLDVARHYQSPAFLRKFIDLAAFHKFNRVQFHLTDDQGWRLEIRRYPRLTEIGSVRRESPRKGQRDAGDGTPYGPFFYTQAEVRALVAYARARHIELVPEIEMPGHFLAALTAYPEFSCTGGPFQVRTRWGIEPDVLCAGNDRAIEFALGVLEEVVELFPGEFIHIGGDEAPRDRWKTCPKCQARMRAEGLTTEAQLQTYLNRRIEQFLSAKGRRLLGWDEILEGGLTPGATVMSWRGMEGGLAAAGAGHDVVMSPTSHCYLDYAQAKGPGEPECIGGFLPLETVYAFEPVPPTLAPARRHHILGAQGNVWTEYIRTPAEVEYFAFPRACALAEVVWSPAGGRDFGEFRRRLARHLERLEAMEVNYRRLDRTSPP